MTKNDLKTGMVVETKDGNKWFVARIDDSLYAIGEHLYMRLDSHKENMLCYPIKDLSIQKVYKPSVCSFDFMIKPMKNELIWERKEVKKMTVAEICEALGYEVEIVK